MNAVERVERAGDAAIRLLGNRWFLALIVFFFLASVVLEYSGADPDMFARVAVGRLVERDGHVSRTDPFAYTPTHDRWIDHEWLAGVAMWKLASSGGDRALILFALGCMAATIFLVAAGQLRFAGAVPGAGAWLFLCLAPLPWVWMSIVRSRALTYVLLPLFLLVLVDYRRRRDPRVLIPLPFLMVVWANWHGGFVIGLGFLGIAALVASLDGLRFALPLWVTTFACALVTLVNPYGLEYWLYLRDALTMDRSSYIGEWKPLLTQAKLVPWVAAAALLWIAEVVRKWRAGRRELPLEAVLLPALALVFAIDSNRLAAAFFVTVGIYGASALEPIASRVGRRVRRVPLEWRRSAALVAVPSLLLLGLPTARAVFVPETARLRYDLYPVHALEWLRESRPGGDVMVEFVRGSYALWRLHPDFQVSLDGRYEEVYPQSTFDLVALAFDPRAEGHEEAFEKVRPDYIVLDAENEAFDRPELFGPEWTVAYRDSVFAVLESDGEGTDPAGPPASVRPVWDPLF